MMAPGRNWSWSLFVGAIVGLGGAAVASEPRTQQIDSDLHPFGYAVDWTGRTLVLTSAPAAGLWAVEPAGGLESVESPFVAGDGLERMAQGEGELWVLSKRPALHGRDRTGVWTTLPLAPPESPEPCRSCTIHTVTTEDLIALGRGRAALLRQYRVRKHDVFSWHHELWLVDGKAAARQVFPGKARLASSSGGRGMLLQGEHRQPWTVRMIGSDGLGPERTVSDLTGRQHVLDRQGDLWITASAGSLRRLPAEASSPETVFSPLKVQAMTAAEPGGVWVVGTGPGNKDPVQVNRLEADRVFQGGTIEGRDNDPYIKWHVAETPGGGLAVTRHLELHLNSEGAWTRFVFQRGLQVERHKELAQRRQTSIRRVAPWLAWIHPMGISWLHLSFLAGVVIAAPRLRGDFRRRWPGLVLGLAVGVGAALLIAPLEKLGSGWTSGSSSMGISLNAEMWWIARASGVLALGALGLLSANRPSRRGALVYGGVVVALLLAGTRAERQDSTFLLGLGLLALGFGVRWLVVRSGRAAAR